MNERQIQFLTKLQNLIRDYNVVMGVGYDHTSIGMFEHICVFMGEELISRLRIVSLESIQTVLEELGNE